jgi:UDP-glucose 4-epimerase
MPLSMITRDAFKGSRVLITGGLGFIGSNLAHRLVEAGAQVTLIDNLLPEYGGNLFNVHTINDRVAITRADVRDRSVIEKLVCDKDYLFNLAGQTSHQDSMQFPTLDLEMNCGAPLSVLEACRRFNSQVRIIFASTRQVYGRPQRLPVAEDHPLAPVDVNGIHKVAGESYHRLYSAVHDMRTCCLRLTNTIGPRMRIKDSRQTFLGYWFRCALEGRAFEVWGGAQLRDFTYVDDAVDAFVRAAERIDQVNGQVLNIGGCEPIALRDLAALVVASAGSGSYSVVDYPPSRKAIDIGDFYADGRLAQRLLDWKVDTALAPAIARTLDFYREHRERYT